MEQKAGVATFACWLMILYSFLVIVSGVTYSSALKHVQEFKSNKAAAWGDLPQGYSVREDRVNAFMHTLQHTLLREGFLNGWLSKYILKLQNIVIDPTLWGELALRFVLPQEWTPHWDRTYLAPPLFRRNRESHLICKNLAKNIKKGALLFEEAVYLLQGKYVWQIPPHTHTN